MIPDMPQPSGLFQYETSVSSAADAGALIRTWTQRVWTGGMCVPVVFFQAEDGIRDVAVTGVQTCALPIWFSPNDKGERAGVGRIVLAGDLLELECLSAQQGERGRALLEQLATAMILHRCTWQENLERILRDYIREERQREPDFGVCGGQEVRHEEEEAFFLDQMARHYRQWIDEPLPELDNHTPRDAARNPALRPKLVDLIRELEGEYHRNLKSRAPAYDP